MKRIRLAIAASAVVLVCLSAAVRFAHGDDNAAAEPATEAGGTPAAPAKPAVEPAQPGETPGTPEGADAAGEQPPLSMKQDAVSLRYKRFEKTLRQMAEYMRKTDPDRANLLYRAINKSSEDQVAQQLDEIVALLRDEHPKFGEAVERQQDVGVYLQALLKLLQSEDRKSDLDKERKRVEELLKELNQLIPQQKLIRNQTNQGRGGLEKIAGDQQKLAEAARKLREKIDQQDAEKKGESGKPGDARDGDGKQGDDKQEGEKQEGDDSSNSDKEGEGKSKESESGEGKSGKNADGEENQGDSKPSDGKSGDGKSGDKQPGDEKSEKNKPDEKQSEGEKNEEEKEEDSKPSEGQPGGEPSDGKPSEGKPSEGKPGKGKPSEGKPSEGQSGEQGESGESGEQGESAENESGEKQSERTPGRDELEKARQEMEDAIEKLKSKQRENASDHQDEAIKQLMAAKEKLEDILRQLREEERELLLAALEARFQKMLAMQMLVNKGTVDLSKVEKELTSQHLGRMRELAGQEDEIAVEAAKALNLLQEEGSSVAFPEAVMQIRQDMLTVARRLERNDVGELTQGIEQDIVESLEEMIEAMRKEMEKLKEQQEQQKSQQQQQQGDESLVDTLAELKMLRSLQHRINRRTKQLGELTKGEQATEPDAVTQLQQLSQRQSRVQEATYDLSTGKNQ